MSTTTPNYNFPIPQSTDLVKDGATAIAALGTAIDTDFVDLKGGTTGQVLAKTSGTDLDFTWVTTDDTNAIQNAIVDAKGDLIAASANDTPARLAVGNNGETLVADSSASTGLRYNPQNALANPIINGGMDNWQRGTSFSLSASTGTTYVSDRWATGTGANQACTISRQATGDTTNLPNIQYALRFQRNSGQTGTGGLSISTSLETVNTIPFAGKTVTMSFYARKGATYSGATFTAYLITGTGTDQNRQSGGYTGESTAISAAITLTTSWVRYVVTGTIPTTATEMAPYIFFDFAGTAGATDYFDITGFQIDLGTYTASTAPAFRRSQGTIQGELAACQRYYYRQTASQAYSAFTNWASAYTTAIVDSWLINFPVTMRIPQTSGGSLTTSNIMMTDGNSIYSTGTFNLATNSQSVWGAAVRYQHGTAVLTQYRTYQISANNNAAAFIEFSAEL
jgi:hypothetical protein